MFCPLRIEGDVVTKSITEECQVIDGIHLHARGQPGMLIGRVAYCLVIR
jgi:hypothetical protein